MESSPVATASETPARPQSLSKKPSLSILSGSSLNKLNNAQSQFPQKPFKERVISESTGLIKFSLKSKEKTETDTTALTEASTEPVSPGKGRPASTGKSLPASPGKGLPIYIPVEERHSMAEIREEEDEVGSSETGEAHSHLQSEKDSDEFLFKLASKQRKVLDLKEELAETERELERMELEYRDNVRMPTNSEGAPPLPSRPGQRPGMERRKNGGITKKQSILELTQQIGKRASKINFGVAFKEKPELPIADGLNTITENIAHNEILIKGRTMIQNLNRENEKWRGIQAHALRERLQRSQIAEKSPFLESTINKLISGVFEPETARKEEPKEVAVYDSEEEELAQDYTCHSFDYSECPNLEDANDEHRRFRSKLQGTMFFPSDTEEE